MSALESQGARPTAGLPPCLGRPAVQGPRLSGTSGPQGTLLPIPGPALCPRRQASPQYIPSVWQEPHGESPASPVRGSARQVRVQVNYLDTPGCLGSPQGHKLGWPASQTCAPARLPALPTWSGPGPALETAAEDWWHPGAQVSPEAPAVGGADPWEVGPLGEHLEP